jgi:hypothetical protein
MDNRNKGGPHLMDAIADDIYRSKEFVCQVDPLLQCGLNRSSLYRLRQIIADLEKTEEYDAAYEITLGLADSITLSQFINTIFLRAENGYVQFRMFIDGKDKEPWGRPWMSARVSDKAALIRCAIRSASQAALSAERVNFCPPVCTFIGTNRARIVDTCEGVAIMAECDDYPILSRQALECILGTPTLVVTSGGIWTDPETGEQQDKVHLYWRLAQPTRESADHDKLREARELASLIVSSDPTAKPPVHPLRWPGSWHKKSEPRLAQIAEINHEVEVELGDALVKLRETAHALGVTTQEEKRNTPAPDLNLSRETKWNYDHVIDGYCSLSSGRHHAMSSLAVSLAMSALNAGYDIESGELQDLLAQAQRDNPPSSPYSYKELAHLAGTSIPIAKARVGDDPAYKKKAEAQARQDTEDERIRRDIEEMDAEGEMNKPRFDDDDEPDDYDREDTATKTAPPSKTRRFRRRSESRDLPPPDYLVEGFIAEDSDVCIYADSQELKTFLILDVAASAATGMAALEQFKVNKPCVVFYLAGEGRRNIEKRRLTAWEIAHGLEPYSADDVFIGDGVKLLDLEDMVDAIEDMEYFLGDRKGKVSVIIVIDTMNRALHGEKEDDSGVAAKYLNNMKTMRERVGGPGSATITITHCGKDRARRIRGSSGWFAGFDTVFTSTCVKDEETGVHTVELLVEKQKDGEDGQRYSFHSEKISITDEGTSSLVLHQTSDTLKKKKPMNYEDVFRAIKKLAPDGSAVIKRDLAKQVALDLGITIDGVETALDRDKEKGGKDRYKNLRDGNKFCLPSWTLGSEQSIQDQIRELRASEVERITKDVRERAAHEQVQEQMDSLFPNGRDR